MKISLLSLFIAVASAVRVVQFKHDERSDGSVSYSIYDGTHDIHSELPDVFEPILLEVGNGFEFTLVTENRIGRQRVGQEDPTRHYQVSDLESGENVEVVVVREGDADAFAAALENADEFILGGSPVKVLAGGIDVPFYAFQCVAGEPNVDLDHTIFPANSNSASGHFEKYSLEICWSRGFSMLKSKQDAADHLEGEVGVVFLLFPRLKLAAQTNVYVEVRNGVQDLSDVAVNLFGDDEAPNAEDQAAELEAEVDECCQHFTSASDAVPAEGEQCLICIEKLSEGTQHSNINNAECSHKFHQNCLRDWARRRWLTARRDEDAFSLTCPTCRRVAQRAP